MSAAQPAEKLSQTSTSTPRGPSSDHRAISMAPVSDPGTMARRWESGRPSTAAVRPMASPRRTLPAAERWERPTQAAARADVDQPGRLAQGPEEKWFREGLIEGFRRCTTC